MTTAGAVHGTRSFDAHALPSRAAVAAAPTEVEPAKDPDAGPGGEMRLLQGLAFLGLTGTVIDWARWGAAFGHNRRNGSLGQWAIGLMPFGPGIHNGIVPHEGGLFGAAYAAKNSFGTVMATAGLVAALGGVGIGFRRGAEDAEGPVETVTGGMRGIVQTKAGRMGLLASLGPLFIWGSILHAGKQAAGTGGLWSIVKAGQTSELRGNTKVAWAFAALMPVAILNLAGAFDFLDMDRESGAPGVGETFVEGAKHAPRAFKDSKLPFIPDALVGWFPGLDEG